MLTTLAYNLIITITFLLYIPVILWRVIFRGKNRRGLRQRFGYIDRETKSKLGSRPLIWVHAVSVGETAAASPIVTELKREYPTSTLVFTTVTDTGQEMARKIIKESDITLYLPIDLPWAVRRFVRTLKPDLLVLMESELWPNLIRITKEEGGHIILANGRISDSSYKRYRYLGPIWRKTLASIDHFCMQSQQDVERIIALGADPNRVTNSGNTKFDRLDTEVDPQMKEDLYSELKLSRADLIMVAGSTHPNEEEQLLDVYKELRSQFPELVFILAPRHIERTDAIARDYEAKGISTIRRTRIEERRPEVHRVIILDTIGELTRVYQVADIVFVGGSLIPRGGHNILEPAAAGKAVLFGPHMFNFVDSTRLLLENHAGIQVKDKNELVDRMRELLQDRDKLKELGQRAVEVIEQNKGAAKKTVELVGSCLTD